MRAWDGAIDISEMIVRPGEYEDSEHYLFSDSGDKHTQPLYQLSLPLLCDQLYSILLHDHGKALSNP